MVYKFFDKESPSLNKSSGSGIVNETNYLLTNQLVENVNKENFMHLLETIFGVLI